MKFQKLSLVASALTKFTVGAIALSVSIVPLTGNAQAAPAESQKLAQAEPQTKQGPNIQLTDQQKQQIIQIRTSTDSKIEKLLTKDQRNKIQTGLQSGQPPQQVFTSVLSPEQQTKIQQIIGESRQQIAAVLTTEQKNTLQKWYQDQRRGAQQQKK